MRIALLIIAALALIGFVVVAVVLPQRSEAEAKEAAQALISGADAAQKQVSAQAEKAGNLAGSGKGVKIAPRNDPQHGELKWIVWFFCGDSGEYVKSAVGSRLATVTVLVVSRETSRSSVTRSRTV